MTCSVVFAVLFLIRNKIINQERVNEEKQKEIFDNSKDRWRNGYGTIKELKSELDEDNLKLDDAFFDITDADIYIHAGAYTSCFKCSNSNSVLFPEYEENLCFDNVSTKCTGFFLFIHLFLNLVKESFLKE